MATSIFSSPERRNTPNEGGGRANGVPAPKRGVRPPTPPPHTSHISLQRLYAVLLTPNAVINAYSTAQTDRFATAAASGNGGATWCRPLTLKPHLVGKARAFAPAREVTGGQVK